MKKHTLCFFVFLNLSVVLFCTDKNSKPSIVRVTNIETLPLQVKTTHTPLDIPYPKNHPLIAHYHKMYSTPFGIKQLQSIMQRAVPYRFYIQEQLKKRNMPLCLEFLPVIESNFKITAQSKSGALGLWQFMENSISGLLKKNHWIDERLDPWASTNAALQKLQENYTELKNWELALAAYNMGLGGLKKVIKKTSITDFWTLADKGYLRQETKAYVPKFLAIADLITNDTFYGMTLASPAEDILGELDKITLHNSTNIAILSHKTGIDIEIFKFFNPALLHDNTPPYQNFKLRVPVALKSTIETALSDYETENLQSYTVRQGDTLWGIAKRFKTTVEKLCFVNNRKQDAILSIGTILFVPIVE